MVPGAAVSVSGVGELLRGMDFIAGFQSGKLEVHFHLACATPPTPPSDHLQT